MAAAKKYGFRARTPREIRRGVGWRNPIPRLTSRDAIRGNFEQAAKFRANAFPDIPREIGRGSAPLSWKVAGCVADFHGDIMCPRQEIPPVEFRGGVGEIPGNCVANDTYGILRNSLTHGILRNPPGDVAETGKLALCVNTHSDRFY